MKHIILVERALLPCMNKLCKCYKKDVIKSLEIEVKSYGKPIGIFKCDTCGLSYSRFLSTDNDNKYEVLKILDYGVLWTKILEEYLKSGQYSLYEISKMMGCSYNTIYNTKQLDIKKFKEVKNFDSKVLNESKKVLINELDLNQNLLKKDLKNIHLKEYQYIYNHEPEWLKSLPSKHNPYKDSEEKLKVYKKELLEVMHENPNITTSELFGKINSRLYYIKDHDPTWWKENIQVSESKQIKGEEKIDWQKRDKDLLKSLLNKYEEINNRNEVTRITFSLLQREVFEICFNSDNLKKMPNSKAYIESIIDTTQSYRMKSYKRFIDKKLENDTSFTVNDIPKDFLYFNKQDESVKRELEDYIFNLKNKLKIL